MECVVSKNWNDSWGITPTEGAFAGQEVASAEALNMAGVTFNGATVRGYVKATWGLSFSADVDPRTVKGLGVGKPFSFCTDKLRLDSDGVKHPRSLRLMHGAARLVAIGADIWAKGEF